MDFTSSEALVASMILGCIGLVVLRIGWKERRFPQLGVGMALMMLPYCVTSLLPMTAVGGLLLGVLWATRRG